MEGRTFRVTAIVAGAIGLGMLLGATVLSPEIGAAAENDQGSTQGAAALCDGIGLRAGDGPFATAAETIGITPRELMSALADGDTIADVADAHGVPLQEVIDAMVANEQEHLDAAVAEGRLTQAQADELAAGIDERMRALANGDLPFGHGPGPGWPGTRWMPAPGGTGSGSDGSTGTTAFEISL